MVSPAQVWLGPMPKTETATAINGTSPTNDAEFEIQIQKPYRVLVELEGSCPLLFHKWSNEGVAEKAKAKKGSDVKKTDDTESYLYRDAKGMVCVPGEYLRQSIIHAAKYEADPRSPRKSLMDLCKAAVVSLTELASTGIKEPDYIDKRRVVIQRNAITRSRPALKEGWKAAFFLQVNLPEYLDAKKLNYLCQQAGRIIGLGDFRPSYGRFNVTKFEVMDD